LNTDLKPVCYYLNTLLWGGITLVNLKRLLTKIFNLPRSYFFLLLIPLLLFLRHKKIIPLSVCGAGATGISSEIILLIIFQSFHGYLYHWIGIIVGLFMLGLGMGTLLFIKKFQNIILSKSKRLYFLSIVQFTLGAYLLLILLFTRILDTGYVIAFFVFVAGFIGGIHFPLAITLSGKEKAGLLYGIDLLGASLGAILTTIIFIPILGIVETIIAFTLMNVIIGFGILMVRAKIG
ncbi:MAG: hypothetical protein N3A65_09210, partial [candidate division WOR-3 bacterium]|nr:hypothetical protein [candidate division WOR-3 bacterium]